MSPHHNNSSGEHDGYYYDYYYYYDEEDGNLTKFLESELWIDPCNEYSFSVLFFIILILAFIVLGCYVFLLIRRRKSGLPTALDAFIPSIILTTLIQLTPKMAHYIYLHGHPFKASQTGCKLSAYTTIGMPHVVTLLVTSLVGLGVYANKYGLNSVDAFIRRHFAWLLLIIFALEGVTGMVPAIYMDLASNGRGCNSTQSLSMTPTGYAMGHIMLFSILPYLLPFLCVLYPLINLTRNLSKNVSEDDDVSMELNTFSRTVVVIVWSYIVLFSPLAIMAMIVFGSVLDENPIDFIATCHTEQVFKFFQDSWLIFLPLYVIWHDRELSRDLKVKSAVKSLAGDISRKLSPLFRARTSVQPDNGGVRLE